MNAVIKIFLFLSAFMCTLMSAVCQNTLSKMHPDTTICTNYNFSIQLQAPENASYYYWNTTETTDNIFVDEAGEYWVEYAVGDEISIDTFRIKNIICNNGKDIIVPTAFSPNDDGKNDNLHIFLNNNVQLISFVIFDRRGNNIFSTSESTTGWDGRYKGILLPVGNYEYFLSYKNQGDKIVKSIRGNITLLR